jgi:hypothetical protein
MLGRSTLSALAAVCVFASVFAACAEDTTKYGDSNGLAGKHLPTPSTTATATPGTDGGGMTDGLAALCAGAGPIASPDGGPCPVSFQMTIYPKYMAATGTWKCADAACHGPGSLTSPSISDNPKTAYLSLANYKGASFAPKPYINPCVTDPAPSAMTCNLAGACLPLMPTTGVGVTGAMATTAEQADVATWLACGAPFN